MEMEVELDRGTAVDIICPKCSGTGELATHTIEEHYAMRECEECDGSGKIQEVLAEGNTVYVEIDIGQLVADMEPTRMEGL